MSLINDALKRAQQVQTQQLPTGPMLRPVEPEHKAFKSAGLMLPMGLALIALAMLFLVWKIAQTDKAGKAPDATEVRAISPKVAPPSVTSPATPLSTPAAALNPPQATPPAAMAVAAHAQAAAVPSALAAQPGLAQLPTAPDAVQPIQPAAEELKLQSIMLSQRPSAMISGVIVYPGDVVAGYKVKSIAADRVELASETRTFVLTLR